MAQPANSTRSLTFWRDPDRQALFNKLFDEGLSYAEIGRRLGVSKNTITGRVWRVGKRRRAIITMLEPAVREQFQELGRVLNRADRALLREAIGDLLKKHSKIAA